MSNSVGTWFNRCTRSIGRVLGVRQRGWVEQPRPIGHARYQRRRKQPPWDAIMIGMSCLIVGLRLMGQFSGSGPIAVADSAMPAIVQVPLSTQGASIIDRQGQAIALRGVNWFGLETKNHAPHGLWARDYKTMLAQIKGLGYNSIRLPFSIQALSDDASTVSGVEFTIGSNQELKGKTPLEIMDAIVTEAGKQGLMIILDCHRLNNQRIPELWYGDGFTEWDWIRGWAMLTERYKDQPNVIGADLKNEPHGKATWGTGDRKTDWRLAAERAGNAILNINPNWLIFVEGIEENVPGQKLGKHWMGGNLEGVKKWPIRLNHQKQLVYAPHEYGPALFKHTWFADAKFPQNLVNIWDTSFYYIAREGIAPIWIGEFGGREVDRTSKSGQWQNALVDFIKQEKLGFAYWAWNPNSGDTGGILQDDWQQVHADKQTVLNQLLPALPMDGRPGTIALTNLKYGIAPSKTVDRGKDQTGDRGKDPGKDERPLAPTTPATNQPSPATPTPTSSPGKGERPLAPTTPPSPTPAAKPDPNRRPSTTLVLKTRQKSDWETGFCTSIKIINPTDRPIGNWGLQFTMPNATIDQKWNAEYQADSTGNYNVQPADWAKTIGAKQSIELGFCAKKNGKDPLPKDIKLVDRKA
jgi:endoglucanase